MQVSPPALKLKDFQFAELFQPEALQRLDQQFLKYLQQNAADWHAALLQYRQGAGKSLSATEVSELLIACAPLLGDFIAELFSITEEAAHTQQATCAQQVIFAFKEHYVHKQARRRLAEAENLPEFAELDAWLDQALLEAGLVREDRELAVAQLGVQWLQDVGGDLLPLIRPFGAPFPARGEGSPLSRDLLQDTSSEFSEEKEKLVHWCIRAMTSPLGRVAVQHWVAFRLPKKLDYESLLETVPIVDDPVHRVQGIPEKQSRRDGFGLTDPRMSQRQVLNEVDYCVYCHKNAGDFCSKGFPVKKADPSQGLKINPLGEILTGCPLEEKISEMHVLKKQGQAIAALAVIMVDNPMCPVTGHRICNDCMRACIYQKQEPVNIPQTETGILSDVLKLPWGVEIYDLLTRWNPLRPEQWVAKPYNGLKVMVMGMGPAGFTLAHHLLMEGFAVVGAEGLKIEPLKAQLLEQPIYSYEELKESLDTRVMAGFGGVAEYGITVRWDKNFLKLIYISLMRRPCFQVFGGVRFGGTLTVEDVWSLGFDHLALAVGAGLPKELAIPGSLAPGMRQANDFLMALQLTGAAKKNSLANLQVRLPAVVIGGGLTGVDTATEVQAYYIVQVEKTLARYETLLQSKSESELREQFDEYSWEILQEFIQHGRVVREERRQAAAQDRAANFIPLLHAWGGVTIAYRRPLQQSPAYTHNYEELALAFAEGVLYAECLEASCVKLDTQGYVKSLLCHKTVGGEEGQRVNTLQETELPARAIFVATGARPNVAYEFEHEGTFKRKRFQYELYENTPEGLRPVDLAAEGKAHNKIHAKMQHFGPFTSYLQDRYRVSMVGDTHPVFHGSVVKAIASAKRSYPAIVASMGEKVQQLGEMREYQQFAAKMQELMQAQVTEVKRLSKDVIALTVSAPMAAKNFRPGQFYRVQNYETQALVIKETSLQTEGIAVLGTQVNSQTGQIKFVVLEKGASSRLFARFRVNEPIAVMGPTGVRTKIPTEPEHILFVSDRQGIPYVVAVGAALREAGSHVLCFILIESAEDLYLREEIEAACDVIVWLTASTPVISKLRPQDFSFIGTLAEGLQFYMDAHAQAFSLIDRISVCGKTQLVKAVQAARQGLLKPYLIKQPKCFASIYGPMQCMLKGVCAQCLQWQIDPETGERTKAVFTCSWQDQPIDIVDLNNLDERLIQNRMQEILSNLWLDYVLQDASLERA